MNWLQPAFQLCLLLPACQTGLCMLPQAHYIPLCSCTCYSTTLSLGKFFFHCQFSLPLSLGQHSGTQPTFITSRAATDCFMYLQSKSRFYSNKNIQGPKLVLKFTDCNNHGWAQAAGSLPRTLSKKPEDSFMVPRIKCKKFEQLLGRNGTVPSVVRTPKWERPCYWGMG